MPYKSKYMRKLYGENVETAQETQYKSKYMQRYVKEKNAEKQKLENPKAYTVAPTTQPVQSPKAGTNNQAFQQQNPARLQLNGVIQDAKKNMLSGNALSAPLSASPFKFEDVKPNSMSAATNFNDIPQLPIKKQMDANLKAIKDISGIEKYDKYTNRNYGEGKRFAPNYDAGRLSQDEAKAWNTYLNDQTQVNKLKAQNISNVKNTFIQNNADAVGKGNLFSKDLAGYLPQLLDQTAAAGKGGVLAGGAALALGALGPQVGLPEEIITVPTAIKAGITAGSAKYSYEQMRGASYKNLIDLGVSEETATSMSNDDALIEAAIEAVDTGIDIATLGIGKVINLLGKAGVKSTAKLLAKKGAEKAAESTLQKIGKLAAKYGINVASEGLQESAQEVVGIETEKRALSKDGLVRSATSAEDRQRILESGIGGARLAALLAAPTLITNTAITSTVGKNKPPQSVVNDTAMPTTTAAEPAPVATPPERTYPLALPAKGYTTKPPLYVSPNGDISNKVDKPSIPTRRIVEQFNDIDTPDIIPQSSGGYYQVDDVPLINATIKIANNKGIAPSEVIADAIKPIRADIDEAIAGLTEELQAYTGLGVGFMAKENDYGAPTYIRFSNNEQWYRDFYKEKNRAPNKGERAGIAEQMVMRDVEKAGGQYLDEKAEQKYNVFNNLLPQLEIVGDNALEVFNGYDGTEVIRGRNRVEAIPNYNAKWTRQRLVGEQKATLESAQRAGVQDHAKINKVMDLSQRLGVPVRFVDTLSDNINGKYENGVIYISNKSKTPIKNVFVHELTHFIEASGKYNDLANAIMDSDVFYNTLNEKGLTLDEYKQSIKETYAANGIELDKDGINREIVATFAENYLKDEKMISRLAETDTGLFNRIQNWVKDLLARFRGTAEEKSLLEISKLYEKAFKDAKGKTAASVAKMHISQNAGQEIDRALSDKSYRQEVKLRDFTPQTLIDHGVQNLPMLMNVSHLRENIWTEEEAQAKGYKTEPEQNWHGLGKDLFMQAIDSLDNPIAVYRGTKTASDTSRRSNYFLIVTALTDAKDGTASGNKINVPIYVEQKAFYNDVVIDANKIATVFGKTNINEYINKMLSSGELVRVKRKSEVASGWGQFPASSNNTFSNPTISQPTSGVNTHYMQNNKKDAKYSISGANPQQRSPFTVQTDNPIIGLNGTAQQRLYVAESDAEYEQQSADVAKVAEVKIRSAKEKVKTKESLSDFMDAYKRKVTDSGNTINTVGELSQDATLYHLYNNAKQAGQTAESFLNSQQSNIKGEKVGNSLASIFEPIRKKGDAYYKSFSEYLFHMHNIDRMAQNKPVFGESVTADVSQQKVQEYLKMYPEFAQLAKPIYVYSRNLMQFRVDCGLISAEQANLMNEMYPHYVPTFRDISGSSGANASGTTIKISNTVKKATGSDKDLLPIHENLARQTMQTVRAGKANLLGLRMLNDALNYSDRLGKYIQEVVPHDTEIDIDGEISERPSVRNTIVVYVEGKPKAMKVNHGIFEGWQSIASTGREITALEKAVKTASNIFKKLITAYNPMFTIKNFARDIQDAGLFTTNLSDFIKAYPTAWADIKNNSKLWRQYLSLGGFGGSLYDHDIGYDTKSLVENRNSVQKAFDRIEQLNFLVEQAPRFTEFKATVDRGGTSYENLMKAMFNAADVTVNFGRSGTWGKTLNSTLVPFFNPAIQGTSKMIRTFTQARGAKEWSQLIIKAVALGVIPSVINALLYEDDDEYKIIKDREKDTNYLFKVKDGLWVKMPKGRVVSLIGNTAQRTLRMVNGEENAWAGFISTALSQTGPVNPIESNILSAGIAMTTGKTWYHSDIEPQRLQQYAPGQRYDERTDYFSKWLGGILNYSPKKINYLLDSYTGVIGDFVLPLLTPQAEQHPFANAFTIDPVLRNKISEQFYDKLSKLQYAKNSPDAPKGGQSVYKFFNKQAAAASSLNNEIRRIELSDESDSYKKQEVREIKATINALQFNAMNDLKVYEKVAKTINTGDADTDYLMTNYRVFGAEYALKTYNKAVYEKALNSGVPIDYCYKAYFAQKDIEGDKTPLSASRKKRAAIDKAAAGASRAEKVKLYEMFGVSKQAW